MTKFSELNLDPKVLKAIEAVGYETPTPIQAGAIPPALLGRDVLGIAQTGTGKTASFVLPMITLLSKGRARARMPRSLVLAPTRELAAQVAENFDTYAANTKLTKALLIGGVSFKEQDTLIDRGVDVLIATPGRLLDHFERGKLLLTGVQIMVVDEADRMLDMGFIPDIERIFNMTPFTRQTLFFSATMPPEIERLTKTFLSNPEKVEVARQATASETIEQVLVPYRTSSRANSGKEKRALLRDLIRAEGEDLTNAIVFCNRKIDVDAVAKSLKKHGFDASPIHGDLDQSVRTRTLDGFRNNELKLLVASDVAARGLDVPSVSHVFNYDVPSHAEDYVHRIGRTGRAGRQGKTIMIALPSDDKYLAAIEDLIKTTIPRAESGRQAAPAPLFDAGDESKDDKPRGRGGRSRSVRKSADTAAQASEAAPAPAAEDAPAEKRSRSRRGGRGRGGDKKHDDHIAAAPVQIDDKAPRPEDRPARNPRKDDKPERSERGGQARDRGSRNDRGGNASRDKVQGLGDHMPEFLTRSFADLSED